MKRIFILTVIVTTLLINGIYAQEINTDSNSEEEIITIEEDGDVTIIGDEVIILDDAEVEIIEIEDNEIPFGGDPFFTDNAMSKEIEILEQDIALDSPYQGENGLPQTGGIPLWIYAVVGVLVISIGIIIMKRKQ